MGKLSGAFAILMLTPLLAGCYGYEEQLNVQYRVSSGQTRAITGSEHVNGTILVERGGTLLIDHATLLVEQALVVEGTLQVIESHIRFEGPYERQNLETSGDVLLRGARLLSVEDVFIGGGSVTMLDGALDARCIRALDGTVRARGAEWTLRGPGCADWGWGDWDDVTGGSLQVSGDVTFENGTIALGASAAPVEMQAGVLRLWNATLDATLARAALTGWGGETDARGTTILVRDRAAPFELTGGHVRLLDTPLPRNGDLPRVAGDAQLEVSWTLTVEARDLAGAPVAGAGVNLTSAHPSRVTQATTDERGEATLEAVQYVWSGAWSGQRSGNPHAVRVEGKGTGVAPALVVEAPARVVVPVAPVGAPSTTILDALVKL